MRDGTDQHELGTPRTYNELVKLRLESFIGLRLKKLKFTCDDCSHVSVCEYAFDGYNTNGDCILEK